MELDFSTFLLLFFKSPMHPFFPIQVGQCRSHHDDRIVRCGALPTRFLLQKVGKICSVAARLGILFGNCLRFRTPVTLRPQPKTRPDADVRPNAVRRMQADDSLTCEHSSALPRGTGRRTRPPRCRSSLPASSSSPFKGESRQLGVFASVSVSKPPSGARPHRCPGNRRRAHRQFRPAWWCLTLRADEQPAAGRGIAGSAPCGWSGGLLGAPGTFFLPRVPDRLNARPGWA